ncbi:hypothetical protein GNF82_15285, partial [Clostridium perfringens]
MFSGIDQQHFILYKERLHLMKHTDFPQKQGLYDPQFEKDACGMGFVAHIKGKPSHEIVS